MLAPAMRACWEWRLTQRTGHTIRTATSWQGHGELLREVSVAQHRDDFQSVYGCKLQAVAFAAIILLKAITMVPTGLVREKVESLLSNVLALPHAIRIEEEIAYVAGNYRLIVQVRKSRKVFPIVDIIARSLCNVTR